MHSKRGNGTSLDAIRPRKNGTAFPVSLTASTTSASVLLHVGAARPARDGVRLDLRFVHDLTTGDSQANDLARGLSGLLHGMHLTGIAEGIETRMQADILRAQGWEHGQGYYFGRPDAIPVT